MTTLIAISRSTGAMAFKPPSSSTYFRPSTSKFLSSSMIIKTTATTLTTTGAAFAPLVVQLQQKPRNKIFEFQSVSPQLIDSQEIPASATTPPDFDAFQLIPKEHSLRSTLNLDDTSTRRRPLIVGHRGAVYHELENTRESFLKSYALGADAVELDVFLLPKDNTLICFHGFGGDATPGDLKNYCILNDEQERSSTSILDLDYHQTQELKFNPNFVGFPCDPCKIVKGKIPKLEEVLLDAKRLGKQVKIELKGQGTVEPTLELVEKLDVVNQCQFSSFKFDLLQLIRKLRPWKKDNEYVYKTGALFNVPVPEDFIEQAQKIGASEIHLRYDVCTKDRIKAIHDAGLGSMAWFRAPDSMKKETTERFWDVGNEDESMYQALIDTGVQQMCVNRADVLTDLITKQTECLESRYFLPNKHGLSKIRGYTDFTEYEQGLMEYLQDKSYEHGDRVQNNLATC